MATRDTGFLTRRRFSQGFVCTAAAAAYPWRNTAHAGVPSLVGSQFALRIGAQPVNITGTPAVATTVNGLMPAPTLHMRQGDVVTIDVTNHLDEPTSLHWHGLRLPAAMDGVPGLTFRGIKPGETFTYRFPIIQSGTYWYHSHSGMQEQTGLYGALILERGGASPAQHDRDHIILLSDWTDQDPMQIVSNLKQEGDFYSTHRPSVADLAAARGGMGAALSRGLAWDRMRMSPTDIADVTGSAYTFLINGLPPAANWTGLFDAGERVRLRFINASSMTTFDVRIPGLALTIIAADGSDIDPVTVDEFRIGVAEVFDAVVTPTDASAYTIFAQAQDRSGYARATLAPRPGMAASVPALDPRPVRTMADMGMRMDGMKMAGEAARPEAVGARPTGAGRQGSARSDGMPGMDMGGMDMAGMDMGGDRKASASPQAAAPPIAPARGIDPARLGARIAVDHVAADPASRLAEPGDGLGQDRRRVLTYADLRSAHARPNIVPTREILFHLTGNMDRWIWGFDGKKFSETGPVRVALGERIRFILVNDTMMEHPIHLHGFLFELENGQDGRLPLKHTVNVKPAERASFVFIADTPGHWAFHCHLLYHMETGMFRTILVA